MPGSFVAIWTGSSCGTSIWARPIGGSVLEKHLSICDSGDRRRARDRVLWQCRAPLLRYGREAAVARRSGHVRSEVLYWKNTLASATPVTDGERVIVFFGNAGLLCCDMDGKQLWHVDLGTSDRRFCIGKTP